MSPIRLPRGIAPELLVSQVRNTMPYVFEAERGEALARLFTPARILRENEVRVTVASEPLSHLEYFKLCVSAHYLTCATPVPTDVDNQIRHKLWPEALPLETALEMADFVLESRKFDFTQVTNRYSYGAEGTAWAMEALSGHQGEWFTISAGAYCALKQYGDDSEAGVKRREIFDQIEDEVNRHSEIFGSLWRAKDGLGCLKASASIAHNFGDLDRVMDMWSLAFEDPLRLRFYKLGVLPFDPERKLRYLGRLWVAGELYKSTIDGSSLALENHRHFALRKPRSLRQDPLLRVPTGPFFDDWGVQVARGLATEEGKPSEQTLEMITVLVEGWERQPKTLAYGRGLCGISKVHPELSRETWTRDPARRALLETPQADFEKRWAEQALALMDEIPSRAT